MSLAESEQILQDVRQVRNVTVGKGRMVKKATRYLRHNEKERREIEARRIREMLDPVNIRNSNMGQESIQQARRHLNSLEEDLEMNSAPTDLSGDTKDALNAERKRLEEQIKGGMLSHEEMRRNGVSAVDRHIKWEKANKENILTWKNIMLALNPDSEEQDLCNVEKLRPSGLRPDGVATFDPNAQIAGHFAMTPAAKANWPENMPEYGEVNHPYAQAVKRENDELKARLAHLEKQMAADGKKPKRFQKRNGEKWTCDECHEEIFLYAKGVHIAKHRRIAADEVKMQKELERLQGLTEEQRLEEGKAMLGLNK